MHPPILRAFLPLLALTACGPSLPSELTVLPPPSASDIATPRTNGNVGSVVVNPPTQLSYGTAPGRVAPTVSNAALGGDVSLDFAETDIRQVVAQILGTELRENYTIDPAVKGTATFHTATPLPRSRLLPTLQILLHQDGAALVRTDGLYRVVTSAEAATTGVAASDFTAGNVLLPLRFASADALAKILQPFTGTSVRVIAEPGRNALVISGEPEARSGIMALVQSFDVDDLAGQSYALLPVPIGDPKEFAAAMQTAFRSQNGGTLASVIRIIPLQRLAAVLVVASQPRYIDAARRIFSLVERARHSTERSWHIYYLQNSRASTVASLLQQAFTPHSVTGQAAADKPGRGAGAGAGNGGTTTGGFGQGGGGMAGGAGGGAPLGGAAPLAAGGTTAGTTTTPRGQPDADTSDANPLLGGLDAGGAPDSITDAMRIIPNSQNNAIMIYATAQEETTVETMLRKVDILPLQVRIDAVIAEVTLNDQLQYGTQFFFKGSAATSAISAAATGGITAELFRGKGINETLAALQSVTTLHVLSSPELLVLDNEAAHLQVGAAVPYLSQTSQSTVTGGAPVINSVQYQQTGVILDVTPRVNSGGLVTLDISQEVSDVSSAVTTSGINSPTFNERRVVSRVVVQDGQTVGLAGLIQDTQTKSNEGIPWLKDIPLLGLLAGQQDNSRTRTELVVLITPHVIHDQRDAWAFTQDLREQMPNAAGVPEELQRLPPSGSPDPSQNLRRRLGLGP